MTSALAVPVRPPDPSRLEADPRELDTFMHALFRYADGGAFVSWRAFRDDRKDAPPVFIESSHVVEGQLDGLVEAATYYATRAAQHPDPVVFCPPIATFTSATRAREIDLANGLALSVECDADPQRARQLLEQLLGPATVVVASGGVWTDPASQAVHEKLHLHWRLAEPTADAGEHARLKRARILATRLAGGDATNVPAVHPIRWPGSWHRKGVARQARIVLADVGREVDLTSALEVLESAAAALPASPARGLTSLAPGAPASDSEPTGALIQQILSGEAMHAPICALAFRYLLGGMSDGAAVATLRGVLEAVPPAVRGEPGRWEGHLGDVPRAVRSAREKIGVVVPPPAVDVTMFVAAIAPAAPAIVRRRAADAPTEIPAALLTPPGVLGDVARYDLATAVRPVPVFSVQAALALGSVVVARRYVTSQRNYGSLYFLNVAKSGTGKEHAKTTVERVLTAAGHRRLVGPSAYSSGNAVFSALLRKPAHLAIIDEFGKYMEAAAKEFDNFRADTIKQLMEAFGRVHGDMATPQFSTMTMSAAAGADIEPRIIQRPAITLLAMTTPSSFYDAMRSSRIQDGFLNRFIVAEHTAPRQPSGEWADLPVPTAITDWVQQLLAPHHQMDTGVLVDGIADAAVVAFTPAALERTKQFERQMLTLSASLDREGLGDMPIRSREIAMRLALICCLSDTPDTPVITTDIIDWCCEYVEFFLHQTLHSLRTRVADTSTERTRNQVLEAIRAAGTHGVTTRDLNRGKQFIGIPRRERQEAIESLQAAELVTWATVEHGGAGRPRLALVALTDAGAETGPALVSESHQDHAA